MPVKPVLVFACGNLSRGDDALGPLMLEAIERQQEQQAQPLELLCDFQLQIEHALDLQQRVLVLFIDACVAGASPFGFTELSPAKDNSYTTHAMSPAAVLAVYQTITKQAPPPCFLLTIKGETFGLGERLSPAAEQNLAAAAGFVNGLLVDAAASAWRKLIITSA